MNDIKSATDRDLCESIVARVSRQWRGEEVMELVWRYLELRTRENMRNSVKRHRNASTSGAGH